MYVYMCLDAENVKHALFAKMQKINYFGSNLIGEIKQQKNGMKFSTNIPAKI